MGAYFYCPCVEICIGLKCGAHKSLQVTVKQTTQNKTPWALACVRLLFNATRTGVSEAQEVER